SPERLSAFQLSGRFVTRMEKTGIREIIVIPYRIAYRVVGEHIEILRVFHGARLLRQRDLE
ncbi:MAG: type II toxin-antitoxin system RelE/ParE family toxin, partial [Chloroflexota bacterium]